MRPSDGLLGEKPAKCSSAVIDFALLLGGTGLVAQ